MAQRMDADVLKDELGVNAVRTSHYPQSHYFLDECDRKGLLVFTEIPGWQHIGGAAWKDQAVENVRDMVRQYRNHASIILWGVRINESVDDDEFYVRTNQAAHELDPTRQTGGVRAHMKSSLLEDVYTYNDFIHDGKKPGCNHKATVTSDDSKPYMVTEYNGHMYPTKSFDWEEHRAEHAMRHVRVLDAVAGESDIAGSFGWCMFDYNTHKDFGSGDRICYHGVLDMFRNHKLAAEVYAVQQEETPVLAVSSSMDIGEHPGCYRGPSYILSNADSVRMYRNGQFLKEYTKDDSPYKNLLHGPMMIDEFVGDAMKKSGGFTPEQESMIRTVLNAAARYGMPNLPENEAQIAAGLKDKYDLDISDLTALYNKYVGDWGEQSTVYRFEAIKDGQVVKTLTKEPMHKLHLAVACDHTELEERNTYDVASLRILALDENDNVQSFFGEPVTVEVDGPIEVIGPSVFSLKGGMGGTYIKTTGESGEAAVKVTCAQTEPVEIRFSCLNFVLT
jgi:beta-galactosidase